MNRDELNDVRARAEWFQDSLTGEGSIGGYGMAAAAIKSAEDVPVLLVEVERLREALDGVSKTAERMTSYARKAEAKMQAVRAALDTTDDPSASSAEILADVRTALEGAKP